jgi:hypothetical protein
MQASSIKTVVAHQGPRSTGRAEAACRRITRSFLGSIVALGIAGAILTSASPSSAAGAAATIAPPAPPPLGFELPGSGGYAVQVYGMAAQGGLAAQVLVRAATRSGAVTYRFPGTVEEGSIQADLGAYGEISVVFRPISGGMGVGEAGCNRGLSSAAGYYEGTISFHARGLTTVDASRAKGDDGLALAVLCADEVASGWLEEPGTHLEVVGGPAAPTMEVMQREAGSPTQIQAAISESRGGVAIERSVNLAASGGAFRHRGVRSAIVSPPAPFSGSATFSREGRKVRWRGNLRVDFPGRRNVALTGKRVRARLGLVGRG